MTEDLGADPLLAGVPERDGHKVIGPCLLVARIGSGATGSVYRARHLESEKTLAVRLFSPDLFRDAPSLAARLQSEVQNAADIRDANLLRVYGHGTQHGLHYVIMKHVVGENALERVARKGPVPVVEAIAILRGAARGLTAVHREGAVHRDVKPDWILIARDGAVWLSHGGLARAGGRARSGAFLATPRYLPPEQWRAERGASPRGDVWGLGATLHFLLTGEHANPEASVSEISRRACLKPFPRTLAERPEVSEAVVKFVLRCTRRAPEKRYADAAEALEVLDRLPGGGELRDPEAGTARGVPSPVITVTEIEASAVARSEPVDDGGGAAPRPRRRRTGQVIALVVYLLACAAGVVYLAAGERLERWRNLASRDETAMQAATTARSRALAARALWEDVEPGLGRGMRVDVTGGVEALERGDELLAELHDVAAEQAYGRAEIEYKAAVDEARLLVREREREARAREEAEGRRRATERQEEERRQREAEERRRLEDAERLRREEDDRRRKAEEERRRLEEEEARRRQEETKRAPDPPPAPPEEPTQEEAPSAADQPPRKGAPDEVEPPPALREEPLQEDAPPAVEQPPRKGAPDEVEPPPRKEPPREEPPSLREDPPPRRAPRPPGKPPAALPQFDGRLIHDALQAAVAGQTLVLRPGRYVLGEPLRLLSGVRLTGAERDRVVVVTQAGRGPAVLATDCASGTIEHVTFEQAGGMPGAKYAVLQFLRSSVTVRDCVIRGAVYDGIAVLGPAKPVIVDCIVRDSRRHGIYVWGAGNLATIRSCLLLGNGDRKATPGREGAGIQIEGRAKVTVTGCACSESTWGIRVTGPVTEARLLGNTCARNLTGIKYEKGASGLCGRNISERNDHYGVHLSGGRGPHPAVTGNRLNGNGRRSLTKD